MLHYDDDDDDLSLDDENEEELHPDAVFPSASARRPDLREIGLPESPVRQDFSDSEIFRFLNLISDGWGEYEAGMAIGWTPYKIKRLISDADMAAMIWAIQERDNEAVERAIKRTAIAGNPAAQKLWAFNRMAHRGWQDNKKVTVDGGTSTEIIFSVKQALEEQTRSFVELEGVDGIRALQEAIGLGEIIEAEIIE